MQEKKEHIVIIGGGFGGIAVAKKLRKSAYKVTLIDKSNHHLFQPLLYQVATAALSPGDIAAPIRAVLGENSGVKVIMGKVDRIRPDNKMVILHDGRTITYDRLVMAPGSQYNYFGNEQWEQHAPGLKSISDALNIRERLLLSLEEAEQLEDPALRKPYLTYVIIGGGPTGVEMAGAIAEIAKRQMMRDFQNISENETRVFLVEAGPKILAGYPDELSEKARLMLEDMGVRVLLNTPVTDIEENRIHFKEGSVETPNIIWAAGVSASPLMNSLGVAQDRTGRVKVTKDLRVPEYSEIYVIGDSACLEDENGHPLPALAPVALQQGKFVGDQILSAKRSTESAAFKYKDKGTMATIGRAKAVADIHGWKLSGFSAWFMWSFVHILFLICFHNKIRVFVEWMLYYFTFKRGVRLITDRLDCAYCGEPGIQPPHRQPEYSQS